MTTKTLDQHIEVTPGVAGGMPRIAGRPITVQQIAILHERIGQGAEEIAAENDLALADVHAALAYYFDHQAEMDRSIEEADQISASSPHRIISKAQQSSIEPFLRGVGSVLEIFPSPERFDPWRLGQDASMDQWQMAVRAALADLQGNA